MYLRQDSGSPCGFGVSLNSNSELDGSRVLVTARSGYVPTIVVNTRAHVAPRRSLHTRADRAPMPNSGYFCVLSVHSCRSSLDRLAVVNPVCSPYTGVDRAYADQRQIILAQ